jgi:DmsE family decaheme c-type cytochrome
MRTFQKHTRDALLTGFVLFLFACLAGPAAAAGTGVGASDPGYRKCVRCHDEEAEHPVLSILKTKHAVVADERTPMSNHACVACHGPSEAHMDQEDAAPDITFHEADASVGNEICQTCHLGTHLTEWQGSRHQIENVSCTNCHSPHAAQDPVLDKVSQPAVCITCHKNQRANLVKPYTHPLRDGEMSCTGCHAPHGSIGNGMLAKNSVNDTCYMCHAEKRGPFLWEHQPATEDCTICHSPHGSVHTSMLKQRGPWLCQTCHAAQFHPSTAYSGTGLPGLNRPSGAQQMLGRNCMNCHSEVHGTNHPSGARFTR